MCIDGSQKTKLRPEKVHLNHLNILPRKLFFTIFVCFLQYNYYIILILQPEFITEQLLISDCNSARARDCGSWPSQARTLLILNDIQIYIPDFPACIRSTTGLLYMLWSTNNLEQETLHNISMLSEHPAPFNLVFSQAHLIYIMFIVTKYPEKLILVSLLGNTGSFNSLTLFYWVFFFFTLAFFELTIKLEVNAIFSS